MSAVLSHLRLRRANRDAARPRLRAIAATLAATVAAVYGLIALHVVTVLEGPASQVARDQFAFAGPASLVFIVGALLLARYDDRRLWVLGAVLQLLIIAMYLSVADERQPAFELWGVTLRALQVFLLVPLTLLALRRRATD